MNAPTMPALPHSAAAEEHVLACCLLDGSDTIGRCVELGVTGESFHLPQNRKIFECIGSLFPKHPQVTLEILAVELDAHGLLNEIGGFPYLMQVTDPNKVPTTAHARHFIGVLKIQEYRRQMIAGSLLTIERAQNFSSTSLEEMEALSAQAQLAVSVNRLADAATEFKFADLLALDTAADPDCLLGNRYLGRGGSMLISGPSGLGKSVLCVQLGILFAAGKVALGVRPRSPLRVLIVQAEDDRNDVAEAVQGVDAAYALTPEDHALIKKNLRIKRWPDAGGERFTTRLLGEWTRQPFDLVFINPLFSFAGCDLKDSEKMGWFLRSLLNPVLFRTQSAAVGIHHTKKPVNDPKAAATDDTASYDLFGSVELTNWARAVVSMQKVRGEQKRCRLFFSKRGSRAGITDAEGRPTNEVYLEYAPKGLCWVASDWRPAETKEKNSGRFKPKFDLAKAVKLYRWEDSWPTNKKRIAEDLKCDPHTVNNWKTRLETELQK